MKKHIQGSPAPELKKMFTRISLVTALGATLAACGGGAGSTADPADPPGSSTQQATVDSDSTVSNQPDSIEGSVTAGNDGTFSSSTTTGFDAILLDDGSVEVSWVPLANADRYEIYRNDQLQTTVNEPRYVESGLDAGDYTYRVIALGPDINQETIATDLTVEVSQPGPLAEVASIPTQPETPAQPPSQTPSETSAEVTAETTEQPDIGEALPENSTTTPDNTDAIVQPIPQPVEPVASAPVEVPTEAPAEIPPQQPSIEVPQQVEQPASVIEEIEAQESRPDTELPVVETDDNTTPEQNSVSDALDSGSPTPEPEAPAQEQAENTDAVDEGADEATSEATEPDAPVEQVEQVEQNEEITTESEEPTEETVVETEPATDEVAEPEPEQSEEEVVAEPQIDSALPTLFESHTTAGFIGEVLDDGSARISWNAEPNAVGYNLYRNTEYLLSVTDAFYVDSEAAGQSSYYTVESYDSVPNFKRIALGLTVDLRDPASIPPQSPETLLQDYQLVFSEEFDGNSLDSSKWNTSYLWGADLVINSEEQYYVDTMNDPNFGYNPFTVSDGSLVIQSIRTPDELLEQANGQRYLSGVITSYDAFKLTYGYVEARAKLPRGRGFWSAFWLLNAYYVDAKPEIDIMEHIGDDFDRAYHTYHYFDSNGTLHSTHSVESTGVDFTNDFHTFGVEWKPGKIVYYIDGIERHTISDPEVSSQEMYIIANTAIGGWWPGSPDESTPFPAFYEIDYIRAYQKDGPTPDQPLDDGVRTIPFADDVPNRSANHIPSPDQWPQAYPELAQ